MNYTVRGRVYHIFPDFSGDKNLNSETVQKWFLWNPTLLWSTRRVHSSIGIEQHLFNFTITGGGRVGVGEYWRLKQITNKRIRCTISRGSRVRISGPRVHRSFRQLHDVSSSHHITPSAVYVLVRFHNVLHERIDYVLGGGGGASGNQPDVFGAEKTNKENRNPISTFTIARERT